MGGAKDGTQESLEDSCRTPVKDSAREARLNDLTLHLFLLLRGSLWFDLGQITATVDHLELSRSL